MLTDAGDNLDAAVCQYVDLFYLTLPEFVVDKLVAYGCQYLLGVLMANTSSCNDEVAGVTDIAHQRTMVVNIIVITVFCFHSKYRRLLLQGDADISTLRLVAFLGFYEGTLA